ncbi:MAG: alkaline phosphatase [Chloroflexota bacterium]
MTFRYLFDHFFFGLLAFAAIISLVLPASSLTPPDETTARNVILVIGDGMGLEHVIAGGMLANGEANSLSFESFPFQTTMTHHSASYPITDSAAAGTAIATGQKVHNGVVSLALPGDGDELKTLLEIHKATERSTGLVTTSTLTDATPAAFGAHAAHRSFYGDIAHQFLTQSRPNVLLGGGNYELTVDKTAAAGYTVVSNRAALLASNSETESFFAGLFGESEIPAAGLPNRDETLPTLPEMTAAALNVLDNDPDGFFLVVEHEGIDTYSHANDAVGMAHSVVELAAAVDTILAWMANHPDTLLLVTADHETGGLTVTEENPMAGVVPSVTWSTLGHTETPVPVYALGVGANQVPNSQIDNTDIFDLLYPSNYAPETPTPAPSGTIEVRLRLGNDDIEQSLEDGKMHFASSDLELGDDFAFVGRQSVGLQFKEIGIPQGATIQAAELEFVVDEANSEETAVRIYAHASDSAPFFSPTPLDLTTRPLTTNVVPWSIPAWERLGSKQTSPDLTAVVQEIIDRPDWQAYNNIAFIIHGTGRRVAVSHERNPAQAPLLRITYFKNQLVYLPVLKR